MKKEYISLVYIVGTAQNAKYIIPTLERYGGKNKDYCGNQGNVYFIAPTGDIALMHKVGVTALELAGYKEIPVDEPIEEFTIEEIAKLLGKDPNSIRIKK
jgi:tartrate dehydratase beta subunit/fumarate hydratase class I family protein